jgi:signal transduction histidine kinase/ActR/RegA family two-component response regulator
MQDDEKTRDDLLAEVSALRSRVAELESNEQRYASVHATSQEQFLFKKYEAIGILVEGIAHDFNNLLNFALGSVYLSKKHCDQGSKLLERLVDAERSLITAKDLTYQLLILAEERESVRRVTRAEKLIRNAVHLALMGSGVKCSVHIDQDLVPVEVNHSQLNQVIYNLLSNARDAVQGNGAITVTARNTVYEEDCWPVKAGQYVQVSIRDEGVGIPPELKERIFDPYVTTKERGGKKGTGLGLAVCYAIMKNHGGYVTVDTQVGRGSTFHVFLPASYKKAVSPSDDERKELRGKVLVMDDEEIDRDVIGEMLRRISFDVECARSGAEALTLFREARNEERPFDAVIMDLVIPGGMGAKETITKLLEIDPHTKALVTSGYSNDPIFANFREYGFTGALPKPYHLEELDQILHKVLFR